MRTFHYLAIALLFVSQTASAMNGVLEVNSGSVRVTREDGMKVSFYPAKYHTQLSIAGNKIHLMINRLQVRTDVTMIIPKGVSIPENGEIYIDGFRTGQTFALRGTIETTKKNSDTEKDTESCVYGRQVWVCGGFGTDFKCNWVTKPVSGSRPVEYFYETKTTALALQLDSRNGGSSFFNGKDMERRKFYSFQGNCH